MGVCRFPVSYATERMRLHKSLNPGNNNIIQRELKLPDKGDDILEVSAKKANLNIAAPGTGKLIEILVQEGDTVTVGDVIAVVETDD